MALFQEGDQLRHTQLTVTITLLPPICLRQVVTVYHKERVLRLRHWLKSPQSLYFRRAIIIAHFRWP